MIDLFSAIFCIFLLGELLGELLFLAFFRNRPKFSEILKSGLLALREIFKLGLGIYIGISKISKIILFWLFTVREIWRILLEVYKYPENVTKIVKNGFKIIFSILKPKTKREKRNRKFMKNRSRRAENRNFFNFENKMDYLNPPGIFKTDEENVEKVRSGEKGKTYYIS